MNGRPTVFLIDDDSAVRESLALLLEQEKGVIIEPFDSAETFLAAYRPVPCGCAIIDIRMPGMDGMQLQAELLRRGDILPVIFLTGHGSIPMSVRSIKSGAVDFLTKPVTVKALLESVRAALTECNMRNSQADQNHTATACLGCLSEREREVMVLAVEGLTNKEIARRLDISHRTVEIHRARIMHKTGAKTLLALARIAAKAGLHT